MNDKRTDRSVCCEMICENLSAIHDGENLTLHHSVVTQHLSECSACRAYQINLPRLVNTMRGESPGECDLDRLWINVLSEIDKNIATSETSPPTPLHSNIALRAKKIKIWISSLSIAASIMIGVVVGSLLVSMPEELHSAALVTEIVRDFNKFENQGRVYDMAEVDDVSSISWLAEKVDFDLSAANKIPLGYAPVGSRICSLLGKRIAFIHYMKNENDALSLYVMEGTRIDLPQGGARLTGHTPDGLTTVAWKEGNIGYVIISELPVERINTLIGNSPPDISRSL